MPTSPIWPRQGLSIDLNRHQSTDAKHRINSNQPTIDTAAHKSIHTAAHNSFNTLSYSLQEASAVVRSHLAQRVTALLQGPVERTNTARSLQPYGIV